VLYRAPSHGRSAASACGGALTIAPSHLVPPHGSVCLGTSQSVSAPVRSQIEADGSGSKRRAEKSVAPICFFTLLQGSAVLDRRCADPIRIRDPRRTG
jgi:hypothetical protein